MIVHEEEYRGLRIRIMPDDDPIPPRDWDNLGTMVCFHLRHALGDEHDYNSNDYGSWTEMKKAIEEQEDPAVILPLYLMDHGSLTMSTGPFSCPWDSGRVGFIFVSKTRAREELGVKRLSRKSLEKVRGWLEQEVEIYDQYLMGDIYGFVVDRPETCEACSNTEHEMEASCWGFFGMDDCIVEARSAADSIANQVEVDFE